jgi:hypothetical protein
MQEKLNYIRIPMLHFVHFEELLLERGVTVT